MTAINKCRSTKGRLSLVSLGLRHLLIAVMFHCYDTSVIITIVVPPNKRDFTAKGAALLLLVQFYTEDMWSEQQR